MHMFLSYFGQRLLIGLSLCYFILVLIRQPVYACIEMEEEDILGAWSVIAWFALVVFQLFSMLYLTVTRFQYKRWLWFVLSVMASVLAHVIAFVTVTGLDRMTKTETLSTPALMLIGLSTILTASIVAYKLLLNFYLHASTKLALNPILTS